MMNLISKEQIIEEQVDWKSDFMSFSADWLEEIGNNCRMKSLNDISETLFENRSDIMREDHLSTFAVDVDTGAYTMMRQYVQAGRLPAAEAVRVEEYVNFFDYKYDPPTDAAFAIYADGAPSPFHNDGSQILRVGIQGYEIPAGRRGTIWFRRGKCRQRHSKGIGFHRH